MNQMLRQTQNIHTNKDEELARNEINNKKAKTTYISVPIRRWLEITLYKLTLDEQAINESGREKLFKGIKWHKGQL